MKFYKIRNTKCDFCGKQKDVVTQFDYEYICKNCAKKVYEHARINEFVVENEKKLKERSNNR